MGNFDFEIYLKGIGPFVGKNEFKDKFNKNTTLIYSENGGGKTFISRCFELFDNADMFKDKENIKNKLLNLNDKGNFKFKINNEENIDISLDKKTPFNSKETYYIYHVFNSDYIEKQKFALNDKEGYIIVGNEVDSKKEKEELENLRLEIKKILEQIVDYNNELVSDDKDYMKVIEENNRKPSEYNKFKEICECINKESKKDENFNKIDKDKIDKEQYNNITQEEFYNKSKEITKYKDINYENISDIQLIDNGDFDKDTNINFNKLKDILIIKPKKCDIVEDLKNFIKNNIHFIQEGINIMKDEGDICPFCKQKLSDEVIDYYIKKYKIFLEDEENKYSEELKKEKQKLECFSENINRYVNKYEKVKNDFNDLKEKIPNYNNKNITILNKDNIENIKKLLEELQLIVNNKIDDTQIEVDNLKLSNIEKEYEKNKKELKNNILCIDNDLKEINNSKNNIRNKKTEDKKDFLNVLISMILQNNNINIYNENVEKEKKIKKEIEEIEEKNKIRKNKKYKETLSKYINDVFGDKYTIDKNNTNIIKFNNESINEEKKDITKNINDILSDGEKVILSFCYYLAEAHLKIGKNEDYSKIFFIIDDPISSLDENHIYSVSDIIRNIDSIFGDKNIIHKKYIILTHNFNFLSILYRNDICENFIKIDKTKDVNKLIGLKKHLSNFLRLPYFSHLLDIYNYIYSEQKDNIPHTIYNSLRQVIEILRDFEEPGKENIKNYINTKMPKCIGLYTAINDGSHGSIYCKYSPEETIAMCKSVTDYVKGRGYNYENLLTNFTNNQRTKNEN